MVGKVEDIWAMHIKISPVIAGGRPHIAGHRITVQSIVIWNRDLGLTVQDIASMYHLTVGDVNAALGYYRDHRDEIESFIHEDDKFVQDLRHRIPSKLP